MKNTKHIQNPFTLTLIFLIIGFPCILSQGTENCTFVGSWADGPCYTVTLQDEIAFFGNGAFLEIVDISDPANPVELAKYLTPAFIYSLAVHDNFLYIGNQDNGLLIIDITDLSDPKEAGFLKIGGFYPYVIYDDDIIYFSTNSSDPLQIIDVSDPANPVTITIMDLYSRSRIAVKDNHLYIAARWDGFKVYEMTDLANPVMVATIEGFYCQDIDVSGTHAYISSFDSLVIMDISTPSEPAMSAVIYPDFGSIHTCVVEKNIAYFGQGDRLRTADVSDPGSPVLLTSFPNDGGYVHDIFVSDSITLLASNNNGINIINSSDPSSLENAGFFDTAGDAYGIVTRNDIAYLANGWDGLRIFDITTPDDPTQLGHVETPEAAQRVKLAGDYAFVANSSDGLVVYNISDPSNPTEASRLDYGDTSAIDITIHENLAYMSLNRHGLSIVDISDPENPTEIGQYSSDEIVHDVAIAGEYAYIANWRNGLRILNVADPASPVEVGLLDDIGTIRSVAVSGNYAYAGLTNPYVKIIDISDPANPIQIGQFFTARAYHLEVVDDNLYISAGYNGLIILDISDPAEPIRIGYYDTGGEVYDLSLNDNNVYLADYTTGITVVQFDETSGIDDYPSGKTPKSIYLDAPYPNPFKESTSMTFGAKTQLRLTLTIHDISGRLIRTLADVRPVPGDNMITWDGTDQNGNRVCAGQYFLELKNNTENVVRSVVFID